MLPSTLKPPRLSSPVVFMLWRPDPYLLLECFNDLRRLNAVWSLFLLEDDYRNPMSAHH